MVISSVFFFWSKISSVWKERKNQGQQKKKKKEALSPIHLSVEPKIMWENTFHKVYDV